MIVLKLVPKIVWIGLAAALVGLMFVPNLVQAEDSCGFVGIILGCDQEQKAAEAQGQQQVQMQDLANQAERDAYQAQVQAQQLANENAKAAAAAQNEQQRLAFENQARMAQIEANKASDQLNALVAERMNQTNAAATVNLAAIQADTVKNLATQQVQVEDRRSEMAMWAAIITVACCGAYGLRVYNKRKEVEAKAKLLTVLGPEQRRIAADLESEGVSFDLTPAGQIVTVHPQTGQRVIVSGR